MEAIPPPLLSATSDGLVLQFLSLQSVDQVPVAPAPDCALDSAPLYPFRAIMRRMSFIWSVVTVR